MGRKQTNKVIFENITVLDAGAKGVSVAKAPEGQVIFIPNVVPGDVVDVQTLKKRKSYFEGKAIKFHEYSVDRVEPVERDFACLQISRGPRCPVNSRVRAIQVQGQRFGRRG